MTEIVVAKEQPFPVEIMVYEEDTYLVLSAGNHIRETRQPLEELQQAATEQTAHALGDVVERGNQWLAIVHDFDRNPSWDEGQISRCLEKVVSMVYEKKITRLKLQPIGAVHGSLQSSDAVDRLLNLDWPNDCKIWIEVSAV